jgi:hypothetical protein
MAQGPENVVMPFGKHRGRTLGDILAEDPAYLDWLQDAVKSPNLKNAVAEMNEKYAAEIESAIR